MISEALIIDRTELDSGVKRCRTGDKPHDLFSSFASFSSLTMNVHWRCSSTHISYTVTCTSRPLFCNSFFTHRLSLIFVLHDRRCDGVSPSGCCHRRNGGDQLAERASRVAVAHLHDRDALARHGVTQLHARIYQRAVSVSNQSIECIHRPN